MSTPNSDGSQQGDSQPGNYQRYDASAAANQHRPGGAPGYDRNGYQQPGSQPGVPVGPGQAIKRFYTKYAQFSGRASRSEYWWIALFMFLVYVLLTVLISTVGSEVVSSNTVSSATSYSYSARSEPNGLGIILSLLFLVFLLAHIIPSIALAVRRLHDVNMSGFLYLLSLIPFLGPLILLVFYVLPPNPAGARFDRGVSAS